MNVRASEMASFEGLINIEDLVLKFLLLCVCGFPLLFEF